MSWTIRDADADEREALVGIWRRAVETTHRFLGAAEIDDLETGTALLDDAAAHHPVLTLDFNEQNPAARAWYARRGFLETGRSETDEDGRPYPLLHLRRVTPPGPAPDRALQNGRRGVPCEGARARGEGGTRARVRGKT
jgi:hypothetical protein